MHLIVRAFPVLPGREEAMADAFRGMRARAAETRDFYARHGVTRESVFAQNGPDGKMLIVVTQLEAPPPATTLESYQVSQNPYDTWFKTQVRTITGVDPDATPLGPASECVFDTDDIGGVPRRASL